MKITMLVEFEVTKPGEDISKAVQKVVAECANDPEAKILGVFPNGFLVEMVEEDAN